MRLALRCPGTLTLDYERWSSYRKNDVRLSVLCLWPSVAERFVWACFGRFYCLSGLAVGGFESPCRFTRFIYMMNVSFFEFFPSRFEVNMSCRFIFNSDETSNLLVRS